MVDISTDAGCWEILPSNKLECLDDRCQPFMLGGSSGEPLGSGNVVLRGVVANQHPGTSGIQLALLRWSVYLWGLPCRMQLKNARVVTYINHQGGRRNLQVEEKRDLVFQPSPPCTFQAWKIGRRTFSDIST